VMRVLMEISLVLSRPGAFHGSCAHENSKLLFGGLSGR
jgi:hypothetical protein